MSVDVVPVLTDADRARLDLVIADALGLAAAGSRAPGIAGVLRGIAALGGGGAAVPWTGLRPAAPQAALALSALIHGWDFDDTHDRAVVHTSAVAVASALAVAAASPQATGASVRDGIAAGIHLLSVLGAEVGQRRGVIRTAGLGAIAAAVTAAVTARADAGTVENAAALALWCTMAPTTRQPVVDGSLAKRVQPGFAAAAGVTAAALAAEGLEGPAHWLTGDFGVLPGADITLAEIASRPFAGRGVALKPYPACRYTHAALDAIRGILGEAHGDPADVIAIDARVPVGDGYAMVARPFAWRGDRIVDAQFSLPWQLAAVVVTGGFGLETIAGPSLDDGAIVDLAQRVRVQQDLPATVGMGEAEVAVTWRDGTRVQRRAAMPGDPETPLDAQTVTAKIASCLRVGGHDIDADEVVGFARGLGAYPRTELLQRLGRFRAPAGSTTSERTE